MRLAISTLACPDWTLEHIVDCCIANGIGGIEFRGLGTEIDITRTSSFTGGLARTLALLNKHKLQLPVFATSVTLVSPGPERWQDMLDEAHRYAELAGRTSTPFIRIFGGGVSNGIAEAEALSMARRHLRQIIKICKAQGVTPLLETHDAFATAAAVKQLLHELDPAEVGVLWDVEHTCRQGETPGDTAESLGRLIRHIHLKDSVADGTSTTPRKSLPCLLGQGELPLAEILKAIGAMKYQGWISLETERRWHPETSPRPVESIPHFVRYMSSH